MVRAKQDLHQRPRGVLGAAAAAPRRRRVRRPGRGGRDAQPVEHQGLPGRRHVHLVINNQLGFTTPPDVGPLVGVLHRHRQDGAGADLPRERRRPRGLRAGGPARLRLPAAVPQGRRDRHGLLPAPRPQRGRRPELHAAAHVQADRRPPLGPQALHRVARQARRHLDRGGRGGPRRLPGEAAGRARGDPLARARPRRSWPRRRPRPIGVLPHVETGVDRATIDALYERLGGHARGLHGPPEAGSSSSRPATRCSQGGEVDWALAEALAFGSLLLEGTDIRLAGQDTRRGTFSQRHSRAGRLRDRRGVRAAGPPRPRAGASSGSTTRCCRSTPPSASSTATRWSHKDALVAWEAQFGDFVNGAQIIIDQYIAAAEDKWGQTSGLVLLLPHGYEGQGPEHSSARIERFLTLCAEDNMQVVQRVDRRRSTSTCCAAR